MGFSFSESRWFSKKATNRKLIFHLPNNRQLSSGIQRKNEKWGENMIFISVWFPFDILIFSTWRYYFSVPNAFFWFSFLRISQLTSAPISPRIFIWLPSDLICFRKLSNFPFPNCQNFSFQTVKISLFKLSKFYFSNCQNFPFQTVKISLFKTVKISLFKLSKFSFSKLSKNFLFKLSKIHFSNCQKISFSNCQNFSFQTVKIFLFKLSKFSSSSIQGDKRDNKQKTES